MISHTKLPQGTRWINSRADLPQQRAARQYEIIREGDDPKMITLEKRQRQVIDALIATPLYCASPVRLSDIVHIVKREKALNIETLFFNRDTDPEGGKFGVYVLRDVLRPIREGADA